MEEEGEKWKDREAGRRESMTVDVGRHGKLCKKKKRNLRREASMQEEETSRKGT